MSNNQKRKYAKGLSYISVIASVVLIFGYSCFSFAQNNNIDSLVRLLGTQAKDTNAVNTTNRLADALWRLGTYERAINYSKSAIALSENLAYAKGLATAYNNLGLVYFVLGNYPEALKNDFISLRIKEQLNDKKGIANCYNNIGGVHRMRKNYSGSVNNYRAALEIYKEIKSKKGIANCYNNIGLVFTEQQNYSVALESYFLSLEIKRELNDKGGIATTLNNIGALFSDSADDEKDAAAVAKLRAEALKNYSEALSVRESINDKNGIVLSMMNIGTLTTKLKQFAAAKKYLSKSLALSIEIGTKEWTRESCLSLSALNSAMGDHQSALENYKLFVIYRDSLFNEENTKKAVQEEMQYAFDKKESLARVAQEKKDLIVQEEKQKQRMIMLFVVGCLLLVVAVAIFIFRSLRISKKKSRVISEQKEVVEQQTLLVETKQKEILDSIRYASRIQDALIPNEKYVGRILGKLNWRT
jgi:two-component system, NtrC family, sensor kinase